MSLDMTPVHRNLHTKVTFLGLEFEDLILVLALAALMNLLAHFAGNNAHFLGMPLNIASVVFASRFHEGIAPLAVMAAERLHGDGDLSASVGRKELCQ